MNNEQQYFLSTMKPHFNLRKPKGDKPTMVYLVMNIRKQYKVSLGLKVIPSQWDKKNECAMVSPMLSVLDNKNNMLINAKILDYKLRYSKLILYLCNNITYIDNPRSIIKDIFEMKTKETQTLSAILNTALRNHKCSEATFKVYNYQLQIFLDWIKKNHPSYTLDDCNLSMMKEYTKYLFGIKVKHTITGEMVYEQNNSVNAKVNNILTIFRYLDAEEKFDMEASKMEKIKATQKSFKQEDNQVTLSEDEVNSLRLMVLDDKEDIARDLFLFQLSISQRFSDVEQLMKKNIKDNIKGNVLTIKQKKTGTDVSVPIDDIALSILIKYNYTLPSMTTGKCDKLLKTIAKNAGINDIMYCRELRNDEWYVYQTEKYNIIATHTARRTFITQALKDGLDSQVIKKISGHKTDSAFSRYNRLASSDAASIYLDLKSSKTHSKGSTIASNDSCGQLINAVRTQINGQIEDYRRVLTLFGVNPIEYMEIDNIEELSRILFRYENMICQKIGKDYRYIKEIYNGDGTLKDKYMILKNIEMGK